MSEAQTRIQDVQLIMQKNVKTLIENSDEVARMEVNSGNIKETAFSIQSQARQLEQETKKRQLRLYIILGVIGGAVLIAIIVALSTAFGDEN